MEINKVSSAKEILSVKSDSTNLVNNNTNVKLSSNLSQEDTYERSALQKHVGFFDRNNDSKLTVQETYEGMRALGSSKLKSSFIAFGANLALGIMTGSKITSLLTIDMNNIEKGKHKSDTDIYDNKGKFSQDKFDELFNKYDKNNDNALSREELQEFGARNKEDFVGSKASGGEFNLLLDLAGENRNIRGQETKVLTREAMSEFYDGSLLYKLAGENLPEDIK